MWLTSVPRTHAAGVLQLGDPSLQQAGQTLPTGGSHYTYTCDAARTSAWAVNEITVFGSILHMHKNGAQMYTEVTDPSGNVVTRPNSVEYFDFEHQDPTLLAPYTIAKGSTLTTRCYFDNIVGPNLAFGLGSDQEMCIDFVYYYPVTAGLDTCSGVSGVVSATIDFGADAGIRVFGTAAGTPADPTCVGGGVLSVPGASGVETDAPSTSTASAAADQTGGRGWAQLDAKLALALTTFLGALLLAALIDVIVILVVFTVVSRRRRHARPGAAKRNSLAAADAAASTSAWGENGEPKMRVHAVELTETRARPSYATAAL